MKGKRDERESLPGDSSCDPSSKRPNAVMRTSQLRDEPVSIDNESTGLRVLGLLLQCAECIVVDNLDGASELLPEITGLSSPFGSSPERVACYFAHALQARLIGSCIGGYNLTKAVSREQGKRICRAFQLYNSISPLVKFSNFTTNQAIREALDGEDRVHVIDLDIMQGFQWPGLFQILASTSRSQKIRSLRITGLGPCYDLLEATGQRLADFATTLGLPFEFIPVEGKIGNITDLSQLGVRQGHATVVHWMHHSLYDVVGDDLCAIRVLSLLRPRMVTIVEQDMGSGCDRDFLRRFVEALYYYSALFDAIGDGSGGCSLERHVVEQQLFGYEIKNILSVGRSKRNCERWPEELGRFGFRQVSLSGSPAAQASLLLGMFPWKGYTLVEENGFLKIGWKDLSLLKASAWEINQN